MVIKRFVFEIYKVMYNKELNKVSSPSVLACVFTALFFSIFILDCLVLIEIIFHTRIHISGGKIAEVICFGFISFIMYLLLFKVLKIEPAGEQGYELDHGVSRKIWIIYCINFAFLFILPVIRKYMFE